MGYTGMCNTVQQDDAISQFMVTFALDAGMQF
jgi:hypothetical protein